MSELTAKHLVSNGAARVFVVNRTFERAEDMAARFNGTAVPYDRLYETIGESDIVISSTAATEYVITKSDLAPVIRHRSRPLFLIDIAVPRDIDPDVNDLNGVFLYDIDNLSGVVESNLEERMVEARRAEGIIDEEIAAFFAWAESMEVVPTVTAIRAKAEVIRQMELEKALKRLDLSDRDRKTVEALTCAIVNKMLHGPTARLKKAASGKDGYVYMDVARALYGLEDTEDRHGPGAFRNLLNMRARELVEQKKETGESVGDCGL
jgi:glutamyl-tRNA reductase